MWLSTALLALDQTSKWLVSSWLILYQEITITTFFSITLTHNRGAAFSFLADASGWQRWFFIIVSVVVTIVLLIWLKRLNQAARLEAVAISIILGGALGNMIDRLFHGYVIDFMDFYWRSYHFPTFNVADSALCIGVALLLLDNVTTKAK